VTNLTHVNLLREEPLTYVRVHLSRLLTSETYVIGYGVCDALRTLRIAHPRVIELSGLLAGMPLPEHMRGQRMNGVAWARLFKDIMLSGKSRF
jgi:hypothetical protein